MVGICRKVDTAVLLLEVASANSNLLGKVDPLKAVADTAVLLLEVNNRVI